VARTFYIDQKGRRRLEMRFAEKVKRTEFDAVQALEQIGRDLKEKAAPRAPLGVDYEGHRAGELRRQHFFGVERGEGGPSVVVGADTEYALVQHEELDYGHPRGGEAKWLERTFNEEKRRYVRFLKDRTRRALRR
jgi:hypothetical protein